MSPWLILFSLPTLVLGHLLAVLSLTFGMAKSRAWKRGVWQLEWKPWVAKRWRYSTTIGACMWLHPEHGSWTEYHEWIHVMQYQDLNLLGAILGGFCCIVSWRLGLILWASSGAPWLIPNFITGWIVHGSAYMGAEHERSAYAQTLMSRTSRKVVYKAGGASLIRNEETWV